MQDEEEDNESTKVVNFTDVPSGKWLPLIHLDLIKEKNKPKI